jgi:hypothetical protein
MKDGYNLSEIAQKRLEENNLKIDYDNRVLSSRYDIALYSTVPHKDGDEVLLDAVGPNEIIKINEYAQDDNKFENFKREMNLARLCKINDELPNMLVLFHDDFHVFGVDLIHSDNAGILIKINHSEMEDNNIKLDVNFNNYGYALINKDDVCNGKLKNVDINTKNVFEEYYDKEVEGVENYKHIVTQKFKSFDKSSDRIFQDKFRLDVDDFASFSKVVSKEDFEKQCLDGTLFNNEINAFLENSFVEEHKDLIESFQYNVFDYDKGKPNKKVNRHVLDEFLLEEDLIDNNLYRSVVNNDEQAFINAVKSVTNKEQDKGMVK